MGDYTAKLTKVAASVLQPGEVLLAGVRGMADGSTKAMVLGAAGGMAAGAVGMATASDLGDRGAKDRREAAKGTGVGHAAQVALGLTAHRLLIWRRSTLSGKPKDLIGEIPLERIQDLDIAGASNKLKPNRLTIRLTDGAQVAFELVKLDDQQRIVDEFHRLR